MKIKKNWLQVDAVDFSRLRELLQFIFIYRFLAKHCRFPSLFRGGGHGAGPRSDTGRGLHGRRLNTVTLVFVVLHLDAINVVLNFTEVILIT